MQIIECDGIKFKIDSDGDVFVILTDETASSIVVSKAERGAFVRAAAKLGLALPAHETMMITLEGPRFEDAPLAPPTADEVKIASDYAAELAHPERSNAERQLGMMLGRVVRELTKMRRTKMVMNDRVDRTMPGAGRPDDERAILARALPLVEAAVLRLPDTNALPNVDALDDAETLALAFMILSSDIGAVMRSLSEKPRESRCGYCMDAAPDAAARALVPLLPWSESREHVVTCEHNPLFRRLLETEAELAASERDRRTLVDRTTKLRDLASDLLDAYCGVGAATWQRTWDELTLLCGRVVEPWSGAPTIDELLARAYLAGVSAGHANHGLTSEGYQTLAEAWIAFQRGIAQKYAAIESTPKET